VNTIAVIPARWGSTRFPGKPLASISGVPMVQRVYRRVLQAGCFDEVIVATDDHRIKAVVEEINAAVFLSSEDHKTGSERIWEAARDKPWDLIVNVQGDEPLIDPELLRKLVQSQESTGAPVVSAAFFNREALDFNNENCVKVVLDNRQQALYFSRAPIPHGPDFKGFYQHLGVYAYTRKALDFFVHADQTGLEKKEGLEQLRFLENGWPIRMVLTAHRSHGVDLPADVELIEKLLAEK